MKVNWTRMGLLLAVLIVVAVAGCSSATPVPPTATPAPPTETPAPPTATTAPASAAGTPAAVATIPPGKGNIQGTITAYETNQKVGDLYIMALGVQRDAQGQPALRSDVDVNNLPKTTIDAQGNFGFKDLPSGEYIFAVNQTGDPQNPAFSPVGDSNKQVMILPVKPDETAKLDGFVLMARIEQPTPVAPATPPVALQIDKSKEYTATIKTDVGDIKLQLFANRAPVTVNNFVTLARKGFYDNLTFHRVIDGFMAQGGDPKGDGTGGPGYEFMDEISPDMKFDKPGMLAMANSGPNTNGSQFFITFAPTPWLEGKHTIFGQVVEGQDVLGKIVRRDPQAPHPADPTKILSITIEEK